MDRKKQAVSATDRKTLISRSLEANTAKINKQLLILWVGEW